MNSNFRLYQALLAGVLALAVSMPAVFAQATTKPAEGGQAPLISGQTQDGKTWKLADALGKKVVLLYFYPKDETPGCTKKACGLRDRMTEMSDVVAKLKQD